MNFKLLCLLMFFIVSKLIKPSPFTSLWDGSITVDFSFQIMLRSKENSRHFLSSIKIYSHSSIQNNQSINFQNYPPLLPQILMERGASLRQNS
jgi:hypothetical protein